jgi:hypothetical protein
MEPQQSIRGLALNPKWVQDLNRDNIPCFKSMPDITLPNPLGTAVFIKMMSLTQEWVQASKGGMWQEVREGEKKN